MFSGICAKNTHVLFISLQYDPAILALSVEQLTLCRRQGLMQLYSWLGFPLDDVDPALEHLADDALNNRPDFSDGQRE